MLLKTIPIFFTFNNNYVEPACVAFYSLLNSAKENVFYKMYVLHSDITKEKQQLLTDIVNKKNNGDLSFINTETFMENNWEKGNFEGHNKRTQFTKDTILKCFGAKFFPQYDKIIYSDVDIVVVDDISELYNMDVKDKYLLGVKNPFMKCYKNELSHLQKEYYETLKDSYLGGGIWVMNLQKIREDNIEEKMIDIINNDSIVKRWPDQDIINIACQNKVGFIPLNYISYPYLIDILKIPDFISHYTKEELYDSIINPKIIHFAGIKPWNNNPNYSSLWWTYFNYLNLEKTCIFKDINDKKLKKYRKLFRIFLIISIIFAIISLILLVLRCL